LCRGGTIEDFRGCGVVEVVGSPTSTPVSSLFLCILSTSQLDPLIATAVSSVLPNFGTYTNRVIYIVSIDECWWLTPGVLATQEAELRRIMVQSQPRQIVL
jgi:hypothetical protein